MFDQEKAYEAGLEVLSGMRDALKPTQEQIRFAEDLIKKLGYEDLYDVNEMDMFETFALIEELTEEWEKTKCVRRN